MVNSRQKSYVFDFLLDHCQRPFGMCTSMNIRTWRIRAASIFAVGNSCAERSQRADKSQTECRRRRFAPCCGTAALSYIDVFDPSAHMRPAADPPHAPRPQPFGAKGRRRREGDDDRAAGRPASAALGADITDDREIAAMFVFSTKNRTMIKTGSNEP